MATYTATQANQLATDAHVLLCAITVVRGEIAQAKAAGLDTAQLTASWNAKAECRNGVIRQWQDLTGRQWETHGTNLEEVAA